MWEELIEAIQRDDTETARNLVQKIDPRELKRTDDVDGYTALHFAAEKGNEEICKLIVEKCPYATNIVNIFGKTPFDLAKELEHPKWVYAAFSPELGIKALRDDQEALLKAAKEGDEERCKLILEKNPDAIYGTDGNGNSALHLAAKNGHINVYKMLLEFEIPSDVNVINIFSSISANKEGYIPLLIAAENGHEDVCKLILERAPSIINGFGQKALCLAAGNGHTGICQLLMSNMSTEDVRDANEYGKPILHIVVEQTNTELYKLIVEKSREAVEKRDKDGNTVLHLAINQERKELCELIVEKNPDTTEELDKDGHTVLRLAINDRGIFPILMKNISLKMVAKTLDIDHFDGGIRIDLCDNISTFINAFINNEFSGDKNPKFEFASPLSLQCMKVFKLSQMVSHGTYDPIVGTKVNKFIATYYFQLTGVCKAINDDSPILNLANVPDCMMYVLSHVNPSPLFNSYDVELAGEDANG